MNELNLDIISSQIRKRVFKSLKIRHIESPRQQSKIPYKYSMCLAFFISESMRILGEVKELALLFPTSR